jgi:HIV-1 Vpr-binding protein
MPHPSFKNQPSSTTNQQPRSYSASRDKNAERITSERNIAANQGNSSTPVVPSGVLGDKRVSLGVGAGGPCLHDQLEQGYRQA